MPAPASPFSTDDLRRGIDSIYENPERWNPYASVAVQLVEEYERRESEGTLWY